MPQDAEVYALPIDVWVTGQSFSQGETMRADPMGYVDVDY